MAASLVWSCLVVASVSAAEAPVVRPTHHPSLAAASEVAATDQSLVLLIFSAEWCGPCKLLKKNTLDAADFLDKAGALRMVDVDIDADEKTARAFGISAVPTLVLLSADGKIVTRRSGYVDAPGLRVWIEEGRRRVQQGQWEGTAPTAKLEGFVAKAAADTLSSNDLQRLVALLGEPDPADRAGAARLLIGQREQAMPAVLEALNDPYLGIRIGASELLRKLAPDAPSVDPWQSPAELREPIAALKKWWVATGKLPSVAGSRPRDPAVDGSVKVALEASLGNEPRPRTEAMSTLAGHGAAALPAVREAIKRAERAGDHRSLTLLEDVRWAILIPDTLNQRVAGARAALARGASAARQAAATQLGAAGREGLDALSELVQDTDPLVVESAVRALSKLGGKDALPAMAVLLQASDSNLRMTAAQALGHTKNAEAVKPLLTVVDDPNEIVACAALSGIEEVYAGGRYSTSKPECPPEVLAGLRRSLADSRWRVRAAAAEVSGKLNASAVAEDLKKLLDDTDAFVVKSALVGLHAMGATPEVEQLAAIGKRLPGLRGDAVEMMLSSSSEESVKVITEMYDNSKADARLAMLGALGRNETSRDKADLAWKPLLAKASADPDPGVRRATTAVLAKRAAKLGAALVGPLLADEDAETRTGAAEVVLQLLAEDRGVSSTRRRYSFMAPDEERAAKTNKNLVKPAQLAAWHAGLLQRAGPSPSPQVAAAVYATGDGKTDLPLLEAGLGRVNSKSAERLMECSALAVVLPKLPWPEGKPVLAALARSPWLLAMALAQHESAAPAVGDYLFEPARFRSAMEPSGGEELAGALGLLLQDEGGMLLKKTDRAQALVTAMLESTNAAWRAASVFALAHRTPEKSTAVFLKAIQDPNPWVRAAGVQGLSLSKPERAVLEQRLGPMLSDTNSHVAEWAALGLLESEVREAAGLPYMFLFYFQFESMHFSPSFSFNSSSEERPLAPLETKPAFLAQARSRLGGTNHMESTFFALLLAQYGEFDGLDRMVAAHASPAPEAEEMSEAVLAAIALSRDAKYIPYVRGLLEQTKEEYQIRKLLRALKGMTGSEARQLRVEINKRMRKAEKSMPSIE